jgi:hypothetical protein
MEQHWHRFIASVEGNSRPKLHNSRKLRGFQVSADMTPSSEPPETSSGEPGNRGNDLDKSRDASSLHEGMHLFCSMMVVHFFFLNMAEHRRGGQNIR